MVTDPAEEALINRRDEINEQLARYQPLHKERVEYKETEYPEIKKTKMECTINLMGWAPVIVTLLSDEFPKDEDIIRALRSRKHLPDLARNFLINYFSGSVKRPRGNQKNWLDSSFEYSEKQYVTGLYKRVHANVKANPDKYKGPGTPSEKALERVKERLADEGRHMEASTIREWVMPRNRK